ncbi:MAG: F0F1 ATP synthase subunit B [Flavobacteriia bacterium]|nr:F0F1 ATP synthase subunit B [Flavobacteriia bacterium]
MGIVTPDLGLIFWTSIVFICLLFILTKFVWKPVLGAVNKREQNITEALELAEKTKKEMIVLQASNENLLKEARAERDNILKEAKEISVRLVEDAKTTAKVEAEKVLAGARETINSEKASAIAELKNQVAILSIEIAEKVVRGELSSDTKQKDLAEKLAGDINLN